ncbi:MAG: hypothetical protein JO113_07985 [Candidatus Eremiobacteraeota bacterium]|nr:hypothetical protein [Candidatus Eremiobacteraeota bacterium]
MKVGVCVLAVAAMATGIVNLAFGAFDPAEEPIAAWGDNVPAHGAFSDVVAVLLIAGGMAIVTRRAARFGAIVLALCYLLFAIFAFPRLFTAPHFLGWQGAIGAAVGVGQNLIVVAAAVLLYISFSARNDTRLQFVAQVSRWVFGLSTIIFGLGHFTGIGSVAAMVPKWMPLGGAVWAMVTGIGFLSAGVAILCGVLDVLAARLLALMLLVFSALALAPILLAYPHNHAAWGVNTYNLAAIGATLILAEWLAGRRSARAAGQ